MMKVIEDFAVGTLFLISLFRYILLLKYSVTAYIEAATESVFKKRLQHRCFPVKFAKFLRTIILKNIGERLLLFLPLSNSFPLYLEVIPVKFRLHQV